MNAPARKLTAGISAMSRPVRNCGELTADELRARNTAPWEDDQHAQALVRLYPLGMSFEEIAEFFGLSKQRVQQIERTALAKCKRENLRRRHDRRKDDESTTGREPKRATRGLGG